MIEGSQHFSAISFRIHVLYLVVVMATFIIPHVGVCVSPEQDTTTHSTDQMMDVMVISGAIGMCHIIIAYN